MAEDQEFTDDEQVVLEDSEDSGVDDANISGIIPFVMEDINVLMIIDNKMKIDG